MFGTASLKAVLRDGVRVHADESDAAGRNRAVGTNVCTVAVAGYPERSDLNRDDVADTRRRCGGLR